MKSDSSGRAIQIAQYVGSPSTISLAVTTANVQLLAFTHYRLWASVDAFFKQGSDNTVTATTTDNPLTAKLDTLIYTGPANVWIAGIVASGTGVLFISRLDADTAGGNL